jgi:hypothetical protein
LRGGIWELWKSGINKNDTGFKWWFWGSLRTVEEKEGEQEQE